jgi:2-polyprenyl-6-methoxyphenol hydroxylase-like FAD-dependent oxidoreductase
VDVTLLESHKDFDRAFRGDTLHASVLDCLQQLGLAEDVLKLAGSRVREVKFVTDSSELVVAEFSRLKTEIPFIAMIPQVKFLGFMVGKASEFPTFKLLMEAHVQELIEDQGKVAGVQFKQHGKVRHLKSHLVIAADGRCSRLPNRSGLKFNKLAAPMDVVWFTLPKVEGEVGESSFQLRFGTGVILVSIDRGDYWQMGTLSSKRALEISNPWGSYFYKMKWRNSCHT